MIYQYKGHYNYSEEVVRGWNSSTAGVYYCGFLTQNGSLRPLYIGRSVGEAGMRGRLLDHLREDSWPDATHFGYHVCTDEGEAVNWEAQEIVKYQPKYNKQGK